MPNLARINYPIICLTHSIERLMKIRLLDKEAQEKSLAFRRMLHKVIKLIKFQQLLFPTKK
jgi:phosphomevalonate kinase